MRKIKEFGMWKEDGRGYEEYPSIYSHIGDKPMQSYDKICAFLSEGTVGLVGGFKVFSHIDGKKLSDSKIILTDGVWAWPEDLS